MRLLARARPPVYSLVALALALGCGGVAEGSAPAAGAACAIAPGQSMVLASGTAYAEPNAMAVDEGGVYVSTGGSVVRVSACGGPTVTVSSSAASHLALDATNVYLTTAVGAHGLVEVLSLPKGGGAAVTLSSARGGWPGAGAIAVDDGYIYWTNAMLAPPRGSAVGQVLRVPKSGGPVQTLADGQYEGGVVMLSGPAVGPALPMAIDDASVYWVDGRGSLCRVPKAGGTPTTLAPPFGKVGVEALVVAGATVYGLYFDGTVTSTPKTGGVTRLAQAGAALSRSSGATGGGLVLAGDALLWATGPTRAVGKLSLAGSAGATLASDANAGVVAADASSVYWIAQGLVPPGMGPGAAYTRGRLMRTGI